MKIAVILWLFFVVYLELLSYSACQSTLSPKAEDKPYLNPRKQHYYLDDRNREVGDQRRNEPVQAARPLRVSHKARAINGGANDLKHPHNSHSGANYILVRPFLGFSMLLRHVVLGLLLLVFFF